MSTKPEDVAHLIRQSLEEDGSWAADEHLTSEEVHDSVPWKIVASIYASTQDVCEAEKTVALTIAFAARRSLACWFNYSDDRTPLLIVDRLIDAILADDRQRMTAEDTRPCFPTEKGIPITDCRQCDTMTASTAVAYAVAYFLRRRKEDATYALAYATGAFDESPIASEAFEEIMLEWLLTVAIPAAIERRELSFAEQAALVDFSPFLLRP